MLSLVEDAQAVNNTEASIRTTTGERSPDSPYTDGAYAAGHRIRVPPVASAQDSLSLK